MNIENYKSRLKFEEKRLQDGVEQSNAKAREAGDQPQGDAVDESVRGEEKEQQFQQSDMDRATLLQVRDALGRIEAGTFGRCVVDGGPIEEKRLDAMPWTPYCVRHQELIEAENPPRTPTL